MADLFKLSSYPWRTTCVDLMGVFQGWLLPTHLVRYYRISHLVSLFPAVCVRRGGWHPWRLPDGSSHPPLALNSTGGMNQWSNPGSYAVHDVCIVYYHGVLRTYTRGYFVYFKRKVCVCVERVNNACVIDLNYFLQHQPTSMSSPHQSRHQNEHDL